MSNSGLTLNYYEVFIIVPVGTGLCPASFLRIVQYFSTWLRLSVTILGPSLVLRFSGRGSSLWDLRFLPSGIVGQACWAAASCSWERCAPAALGQGGRRAGPASQPGRAPRPGLERRGAWSPVPHLDSQPGSIDLRVSVLVLFCFCLLLSAASFRLEKGVSE